MRLDVVFKLKENKKLYDYVRKNSIWFKYLNRDPNNFNKLLSEFKKVERINKTNKVSETIDSIDMVSNILKVLE